MTELFRYAAFISYSSKDASFARRLHRALESYRIPSSLGEFDLIGEGKKNRIYPVFRDREELAAGQLGDQIEANLKAAASLIVVCSPHGAASAWVQKEIEFFVNLGRADRVFAIIPDNAPLTDKTGGDCTPACFPPAFRADGRSGDKREPLAADARRGKDGFRNAWLKLVAGITGISSGSLQDRDRKSQRAKTLRSAAVVGSAIVAVGAAFAYRPTWEPVIYSYLNYRRFELSADALASAPAGTAFQDCAVGSRSCPVMIILPQGSFMMGSSDDDPEGSSSEGPLHEVEIQRFAVSKYEITFFDWRACVNGGGCGGYAPDDAGWGDDRRPVINVTWSNAQQYTRWLSRVTGKRYRLLTESEWEYAARGISDVNGPHTYFSWGDEPPVCDTNAPNGAAFEGCWVADNSQAIQSTYPVGSFRPNAFGLYDMHGNVWEWVEDCFYFTENGSQYRSYRGAPSDGSARTEEGCDSRVIRGGAWRYPTHRLRAAYRNQREPAVRNYMIGFRVARDL